MDGIVLYGLLYIAGLFLCLTIVVALANSKIISIRYPSEYFFFAVVIEIVITFNLLKAGHLQKIKGRRMEALLLACRPLL
jgi:hypothetical protein